MFDFRFPSEGLTILHNRTTSKERNNKELPHIIQLNLIETHTKDILRSVRNNEQVRLKLGKKPLFQYGRKQLSLNHVSDTFPSEIFLGPLDGSEPAYFSGKLNHTLEVQQAKQDTAKSDEALAALENTLKSLKEHQASNSASFMGSKNELKKKDSRPEPLSNRDRLRGTTTPSSPFLGASPRLGPTSNPFLSSAPSKDKIRQDAIRIPLVHLLAMGPMTPRAIAGKLNANLSDCDRVIDKVAKDGTGGKKELKDKCFRELDVWKFPYQNKEDREAAIDRAIHAFDRMRVDKNDQLWQLLLPSDERGKGKILSRLNFSEKPHSAPTPKMTADAEGKAEVSDREGKAKKTKPATEPKAAAHKKKLSGDTAARKKIDKAPTKSTVQPVKADGKFKSSERIEDSDEEAEGVEVIPAKPKPLKPTERPRAAPSTKPSSTSQLNGQHRHKLSTSSSGSNDNDRPRLHDERTKLKPRPKPERSPNTSRISPRPRVDSSPQKPSPLGSSPPTNSTDLENSSKASTQSSAPSSPPSSTDMPLSQARKNYSPVIAGKGRNISNPIKRKAEKGEEPPMKRQQIHGLGLSKTLTEKIRQQPTPERRPSESSMSSPEKPTVTRESLVEATMKFREYYARYKDLHVRLARQEPDDRSDRELDQLRKMQERLEKIKSELWSDWEKVGGEIPL